MCSLLLSTLSPPATLNSGELRVFLQSSRLLEKAAFSVLSCRTIELHVCVQLPPPPLLHSRFLFPVLCSCSSGKTLWGFVYLFVLMLRGRERDCRGTEGFSQNCHGTRGFAFHVHRRFCMSRLLGGWTSLPFTAPILAWELEFNSFTQWLGCLVESNSFFGSVGSTGPSRWGSSAYLRGRGFEAPCLQQLI